MSIEQTMNENRAFAERALNVLDDGAFFFR